MEQGVVFPASSHVGGSPRQSDPPVDEQSDSTVHREQLERSRVPRLRRQRHLRAGLPQQRRNSLPFPLPQNFFLQMLGYSSRGQVANRTGYLVQLLLPSFLRELRYGDNINRLLVDDQRHLLYCLYKRNALYGYYLGPTSRPRGNPSFLDGDFEFAFELSDVTQAIQRFCQSSPRESSSHVLSALNGHRDVTPDGRFSVERRVVDRRHSRDCGERCVSPRGYRR